MAFSCAMAFGQYPTDTGKPRVSVSGAIQSQNWTNDNVYYLDGRVYVEPGNTLTIQAGTIIKGRNDADPTLTGVLIIQAGAYIIAEGTATQPIIFTSEVDSVADITDAPTDLAAGGLWGGVVILGKGCLNTIPDVQNIEGVAVTTADSVRTVYGNVDQTACDDADSSGVFRYVSIRHGGQEIEPDNELNGLSLGGVGRRTVMDHIEVIYNTDDGIEWFGGDVDLKYAAVAFVDDDSYDIDQGWRGKGQFWLAVQSSDWPSADRAGEWDGADSPETGTPLGQLELYNATFIGVKDNVGTTNQVAEIRANGAAKVYNSIIHTFTRGVRIQRNTAAGNDSFRRFQAGDTDFANNIFFNINNDTPEGIFILTGDFTPAEQTEWANTFTARGNLVADPGFPAIPDPTATPGENFDPRPSLTGPAYTTDRAPFPAGDDFYTPVSFKGAFEAGTTNWLVGWSGLWQLGYLPSDLTFGEPVSIKNGFKALESLRAFPNPAQDIVHVTASNASNSVAAIYLYDAMGREVLRKAAMPVDGAIDTELNIAHLPAGIYHIQVTNANLAGTATIVKQ